MFDEKDKRTELVSLWVTPEVAKDLNELKDADKMKERIIRSYIKSQKDIMEQNIMSIDDTVIRYEAKMLDIDDAFKKVEGKYYDKQVELIDKIYKKKEEIENAIKEPVKVLEELSNKIDYINKKIHSMPSYNIEKLMDVVERFNSFSDKDKEIIQKLLEDK